MAEVLVDALQLKNDPLALFPTELPLTMPTGSWWAATVWLEQVGVVEGMAEVLPEALQLKNHPLALFPTELPLNRAHRAIGSQGGAGAGQACGGDGGGPYRGYPAQKPPSYSVPHGVTLDPAQLAVGARPGWGWRGPGL